MICVSHEDTIGDIREAISRGKLGRPQEKDIEICNDGKALRPTTKCGDLTSPELQVTVKLRISVEEGSRGSLSQHLMEKEEDKSTLETLKRSEQNLKVVLAEYIVVHSERAAFLNQLQEARRDNEDLRRRVRLLERKNTPAPSKAPILVEEPPIAPVSRQGRYFRDLSEDQRQRFFGLCKEVCSTYTDGAERSARRLQNIWTVLMLDRDPLQLMADLAHHKNLADELRALKKFSQLREVRRLLPSTVEETTLTAIGLRFSRAVRRGEKHPQVPPELPPVVKTESTAAAEERCVCPKMTADIKAKLFPMCEVVSKTIHTGVANRLKEFRAVLKFDSDPLLLLRNLADSSSSAFCKIVFTSLRKLALRALRAGLLAKRTASQPLMSAEDIRSRVEAALKAASATKAAKKRPKPAQKATVGAGGGKAGAAALKATPEEIQSVLLRECAKIFGPSPNVYRKRLFELEAVLRHDPDPLPLLKALSAHSFHKLEALLPNGSKNRVKALRRVAAKAESLGLLPREALRLTLDAVSARVDGALGKAPRRKRKRGEDAGEGPRGESRKKKRRRRDGGGRYLRARDPQMSLKEPPVNDSEFQERCGDS